MTLILRIYADFGTLIMGFLIFHFCSSFFQRPDPRVSAQSASSAFYDLILSDNPTEITV